MDKPNTYTKIVWDIMKEIEYNDPHFDFLASLLSYGLANNGFTKKQIKYIEKYENKYSYIWDDKRVETSFRVIEGGKNAIN